MTPFKTRRANVLACSAAIACLLGAAAAADDEQPAQQAAQIRVLGSETLSPTTVLSAIEATIEPGLSSPSHRHSGSLFVYVLDGEVRSRIDDGPIVLYRAGESWFEPVGVEHSFFENASDTAPARFLIVQVGPPREEPEDGADEE